MPNNLTPEAAIIRLNQFRTDKDERDPAIDMAIRAISKNMIRRKPIKEGDDDGDCYLCPSCDYTLGEINEKFLFHLPFCWMCGQALDWTN